MSTETIRIEGMTCGGCVNSVRRALERLPIERVDVEIGSATAEFDESRVNRDQLIEAIEDAGFTVADRAS